MVTQTDARRAAVTALLRIHEQGGYSNIVLEELPDQLSLPAMQRANALRLVYGVIERRLTLDYLLNKVSSTPVKKMLPIVREILRVGAYQLCYMDNTPAFAAINESVSLTRAMGAARLTGFVNAVLRGVQRQADTLLADLSNTDKGREIRYSCPRGLIRAWEKAYGEQITQGLLAHLNDTPPAYIRVNTSRISTEAFCERLTKENVEFLPVDGLPDALCIVSTQTFHQISTQIKEQFYYQDLASQWCCYALGAQPDERIADVCAAPGGKSFTVAQYMKNKGVVEATDLYEHKCRTITRRAKEFGIDCVTATCRDASTTPSEEKLDAFDRVICDAPCSGLGVIRRKPEIRYKQLDEFADLPSLQLVILTQAAKLVRQGGVLQYSTCTLRPEENEQVVEAFLRDHPEFSPKLLPLDNCFAKSGLPISHQITLFPHIHGTDGFFIAAMVKR